MKQKQKVNDRLSKRLTEDSCLEIWLSNSDVPLPEVVLDEYVSMITEETE